ncbi:MAG: type II toxin-antitoxin system VapC family toxin [Methylacidiphilales bacterium]|nr:type II toxin-antitoxin system VapC family toxin [Candidatus Methylacidiphilales bacterium]
MATPGKSVLLDTSVVIRHFRDANALASRFAAFEELYLPQAALAELYAGAFRSARPEKNLQQIKLFLEAVDVLLPDESTPELYGRISAQLAQAGTPIPQNDIWIAAIAVQSNLPLATCDAHFGHITGLQLLRW